MSMAVGSNPHTEVEEQKSPAEKAPQEEPSIFMLVGCVIALPFLEVILCCMNCIDCEKKTELDATDQKTDEVAKKTI